VTVAAKAPPEAAAMLERSSSGSNDEYAALITSWRA
jgi:hypothetical protein